MEVGAGTFHPATTLRALGPKPWRAAYVQPSRRPKDGRYGENPNRLQHYYQFQVILKPNPPNLQDLYLGSLQAIGIDPRAARHPLRRGRLGEPDARRLGPRLGMLVRRHGGVAVHLFPAGRRASNARRWRASSPTGSSASPCMCRASKRLRPQLQRPRGRPEGHLWRRVPAGRAGIFAAQFRIRRHRDAVPPFPRRGGRVPEILADGEPKPARTTSATCMALPAYDQCIKASHVFNLLDARGVISVTERQSYILRVRELAKACGAAWLRTEGRRRGAPDVRPRPPLAREEGRRRSDRGAGGSATIRSWQGSTSSDAQRPTASRQCNRGGSRRLARIAKVIRGSASHFRRQARSAAMWRISACQGRLIIESMAPTRIDRPLGTQPELAGSRPKATASSVSGMPS